MRISFPLASLVLSGGVKNTLIMANACAAAGHAVSIIVPDFSASPPFPLLPACRLVVLATGWRLPMPLRKAILYVRLALASTRRSDACVLPYSLTVYPALLSRLLHGRRCRILYIVSAYEPVTHGTLARASVLGRLVRSRLAGLSYRLPVEKVYVSRWLARMAGDPDGRVIVLGIDDTVFTPAPVRVPGPVRVGVIGRAGRVKGYADFLAACEGWKPAVPVELRIVAVDDVKLPAGLPARVLPRQDEAGMAAFYRGCDIFVMPSLSEGWAAPPLEAMASGAAVVATKAGSMDEYATDGENALLVPTDDPAALRAALDRLVRDPGLRARLVEGGLRTASRYTLADTARGILGSLDPQTMPSRSRTAGA